MRFPWSRKWLNHRRMFDWWCSMTTPMIAFNGEFVFIHSILVGSAFACECGLWLDYTCEMRARLTISTYRYRHEYNNNECITPSNQNLNGLAISWSNDETSRALFVLVCKKRKKKVLNSWCRQSLQFSFLFFSSRLVYFIDAHANPHGAQLNGQNEQIANWQWNEEDLRKLEGYDLGKCAHCHSSSICPIECGMQGENVGEACL